MTEKDADVPLLFMIVLWQNHYSRSAQMDEQDEDYDFD